jgi:hypothetical protein
MPRSVHVRRGALLLSLLACGLVSGTALAQPNASAHALARRQFREGLEAAQNGDWQTAYDSFQSSYSLSPRPVTLLNLAGAMVQTGHLVEGAEAYRRFIHEATGREARYKEAAEQALAELEGRIPGVRFRVLGFEEGDALALDGWEIAAAVLEEELPVDPGEHELVVTRAGHEPLRVGFSATEGASREVVIDAREDHWPGVGQSANESTSTTATTNIDLTQTAVRPEDDGESIFESPVFWIVAGVVVAGGAAAGIIVAATSGPRDPVMGNLPPGRLGL